MTRPGKRNEVTGDLVHGVADDPSGDGRTRIGTKGRGVDLPCDHMNLTTALTPEEYEANLNS